MPLNIRSEEVNRLAEELALRKGVSKTAAVKLALVHELDRAAEGMSPAEKIHALQDLVASYPKSGLQADKAFYDALNDE